MLIGSIQQHHNLQDFAFGSSKAEMYEASRYLNESFTLNVEEQNEAMCKYTGSTMTCDRHETGKSHIICPQALKHTEERKFSAQTLSTTPVHKDGQTG